MSVATTTPRSRYLHYPTNSAWQSARADVVRGWLFEMLGPECAGCGCSLVGIAWEVNHLYGRDWKPSRLSRYKRSLRYWREAQEGLVDLRCPPCNNVYRPVPLPSPPATECPF